MFTDMPMRPLWNNSIVNPCFIVVCSGVSEGPMLWARYHLHVFVILQ